MIKPQKNPRNFRKVPEINPKNPEKKLKTCRRMGEIRHGQDGCSQNTPPRKIFLENTP